MAVRIIVEHKNAAAIMEIVRELRTQGLIQSEDFDFAYYPGEQDLFGARNCVNQTVFTFYTEKYATLFALKYAN